MQKNGHLEIIINEDGFIVDLFGCQGEEFDGYREVFAENKIAALYELGFSAKKPWFSQGLYFLHDIAERLIERVAAYPGLELERGRIDLPLDDETATGIIEKMPYIIGSEYVDISWLNRLWDGLLAVFNQRITLYEGSIKDYFTEKNGDLNVAGKVFFHLVETSNEKKPFAFMATYSKKTDLNKKSMHTPLKDAFLEFKDDTKKILSLISSVVSVSEKSKFISDLIESGELFLPITLTSKEAYTFLKEVPLYESEGIMCRVPNWWKKKKNQMRIKAVAGEKKPSTVGLSAIISFEPVVQIDGEVLSEKELREFMKMAEGLINYKGKWVEINHTKMGELLEALKKVKARGNKLTILDALRMQWDNSALLDDVSDFVDISLENGSWLKTIRNNLENATISANDIPVPDTLKAQLRSYQRAGYQWLCQMNSYSFGACLADDMGLGKTIQIIGLFERLRTQGDARALLVIPASLIDNWANEIKRFAPSLPYKVLHPSTAKLQEKIVFDDAFLFITTYGMVKKLDEIYDITWDLLVLDESQAIKNPSSQQTKSVKELKSKMRVAMTGTPIENNLMDLWSLFDFLNPGLLGSAKRFSTFIKELNSQKRDFGDLKKVVNPFMLRRLKTDKSIISDLPDKIEIPVYAGLTKKQIVLYEKLVSDLREKIDSVEGIEKKGLVLSSLMKLKQICNHPDHYLGQGEYKPSASGKFEQLEIICETIFEKRERVLVFTQFKEIIEPLSDYLQTLFGRPGLVIHGGTPVKKRGEIVNAFNGEEYIPFMVLSLKAGGVGLNLTAANHVIHFDRWWNPAVENQATDRAFRIGQTKNVIVHKFISKGTIEEKIDMLIEEKKLLSDAALSFSEEKYLTEMTNEEIINLFTLRK